MDTLLLADQQNLIRQLCVDTGCHLMDLPGRMAEGDDWGERKKDSRESMLSEYLMMTMMMMMMIVIISEI